MNKVGLKQHLGQFVNHVVFTPVYLFTYDLEEFGCFCLLVAFAILLFCNTNDSSI